MADKILKDEILSDDELDNVAGGTTAETMRDVDEFESLGVKVRCTEIGMPLMDRHGETTLNLIDTYKTFGVDVKSFAKSWVIEHSHRLKRRGILGKFAQSLIPKGYAK